MTDLPFKLPAHVHEYHKYAEGMAPYFAIRDDDGNDLATVDLAGWQPREVALALAQKFKAAFELEEALARLLDAKGSACAYSDAGYDSCCLSTPPEERCAPCQARAALRAARVKREVGR